MLHVWNAECKCGKQSNIENRSKLNRDQVNEIFRECGWLIADNSEQEGSCICPACQPK